MHSLLGLADCHSQSLPGRAKYILHEDSSSLFGRRTVPAKTVTSFKTLLDKQHIQLPFDIVLTLKYHFTAAYTPIMLKNISHLKLVPGISYGATKAK